MALTAAELEIVLKARDDASKALDAVKQKAKELGDAGETASSKLSAGFTKAGGALTSVGKGLTVGVTAPIVGIGTAAAKMAGDFEAQMNILTVAARSSGTSLEDLSKAALSVGADTELVGITAAESADAMTSLYKAGFDTAEIFGGAGGLNSYLNENASLTGALRSSIDLAAASELDLAQATDATIIAMKTFGLDADEASRVANSFVRTADASVASVSDLTAAMANIGPTAATFGMSLETTNTALGILSSRGIAGAEAGTALKSMLTNMMRQTDDVTGAWNMLGIAMYDADGKMRAMPDILGDLSSALKVGNVLTSERAALTGEEAKQLAKLEERRASLAEKDLAIRNGTLLGNATLKEREAELKKVDKALQTTVFEMEGLKAKEGQTVTVTTKMTEELRNQTVQTLAGTYGMKAMNTLLAEGIPGWQNMEAAIGSAASVEESASARTTGFNAAMEQLGGALETIAIKAGGPLITALTNLLQGPISGLLDKISNLNPAVWDWAIKIGLVLAAVGPLLLVLGTLLSTVGSAITIFTTLGPLLGGVGAAIGALIGPVLLIIGAIALLAIAWSRDWGGIRTFMTAFWNDTLKPIIDNIVLWFQTNIPIAIATLSGFWTNTLLPAIQAVGNWITETLVPAFQTIWNWLSTNIPAAIATVSGFWTNTLLPAIQGVWAWINDHLIPLFQAIVDVWFAAMSLALTALAGLWQNVLLPAIQAVGNWLNDNLVPALQLVVEWLGDKFQVVLEAVGGFINDTVVPAVQTLAEWFQDKLVPAATALTDKIEKGLNPVLEWLHDKLILPLTTALGTMGEKIDKVTGYFQGFAGKLDALKDKLPAWLKPGSPTPLELGLVGIGEAMVNVVGEFVKFGSTLKGANLDSLSRFGLAVRDIAKDLKDLASAFHQMNKVEKTEGGIPNLEMWAAALKESIIRFSRAITEAAKEVKTSTINNARDLAGKIEQIFELLRTLGQVLNDLATIETIPDMAPFGAALQQAIVVTATAINNAALILGEKGLKAAAKLSGDAQKIVGLIGPAVSAMAAMADMPEIEGLRGKAELLEEALNIFIYYINRVAVFWADVALDAAATFAETAQKVIVLIGPAVQALSAFVDFPAVGNLREKSAFLEEAINLFVYYVWRIANFWAGVGLDAAATFAETAQKVIGLIGPGVQALATFVDFPAVGNLREKAAFLEEAINIFVFYVQRMAAFWAGVALGAAVEFAETAGKVIGLIGPGLQALAAFVDFPEVTNLPAKAAILETAVNLFIETIQRMTMQWIEVALDQAVEFSTSVQQVIGLIGPAVDALTKLEALDKDIDIAAEWTALETAITYIVEAIVGLTAKLGGDALASAVEFKGITTTIFEAVEAGLGTLGKLGGGAATDSVAGALDAFAESVAGSMADAVEAIQEGARGILAALRPIPTQILAIFAAFSWSSIGKGIADGIAAGITAGAGAIKTAAKQAAQAALTSAKQTLGIASPSKRARLEVGQMFGRGLGLGITDTIGQIRAAMNEMQTAMTMRGGLAYAGVGGIRERAQAQAREAANYNLTYIDQRPNGGPPNMRDVAESLEWRARMRRY
ncbi:MAG: phage tail tape measure protein [Parcubacteria group bacterium]